MRYTSDDTDEAMLLYYAISNLKQVYKEESNEEYQRVLAELINKFCNDRFDRLIIQNTQMESGND